MSTLRPRNFFVACLVCGAMVLALNAAVGLAARKLPPQQLLARIDRTAGDVKTIFLGDSQMEAGADPLAFTEACAESGQHQPAINAGLGATKGSEHCLLLEHLLGKAPAAETVFYGFYDNLLTEPVPSAWHDLGGNRALSFIFAERSAQLLFPDDRLRQWGLRVAARIPMIAERLGIWARVERTRRRLAAIGLPPAEASRFGRAADFATAEPTDIPAFEANVLSAAVEQRPFNSSFAEIVQRSRERALKFHLVKMPVPLRHRERFYASEAWARYQAYVSGAITAAGGQFLDASDWVPDQHFADPLHVDAEGAKIFSARLAREVCSSTAAPAPQL